MLEATTLRDLAIFTGYSHIGSCREFVWIPGDVIGRKQLPSRFVIRGLTCEYEVEALMIRKDLYLRTETGKEYVVTNFQITDITDIENISGVAENCSLLFEKFPEMKTVSDGERVIISKQAQVMAFQAMSNVVNQVKAGHGIDPKGAREVTSLLVEEILKAPDAMMNLIDIKSFDDYTFTHNINVATLCLIIGQSMGLSQEDLFDLGLGGLLHDIGKLKVSLSILNKDGKLTDAEFTEMKRHPTYGYEILCRSKDISERARMVPLSHHEKFQGKGYPKGLKGEAIPLFGRICAIADVYDALTTDRPYRVAMAPHEAMKIVTSGIDTQFDPKILTVFLHKMSLYPSGSLVLLNDGSVGLVLKANPKTVLRPTIKLLKNAQGERLKTRTEIDLMKTSNLFIAGPANRNLLNVTTSKVG